MTESKVAEQVKAADFVLSYDLEKIDSYFTNEVKGFVYSHEEVFVSHYWEALLHDMSKIKDE